MHRRRHRGKSRTPTTVSRPISTTCSACCTRPAPACSTTSMAAAEHTLYLLPVWLGEDGGTELLPAHTLAIAGRLRLFFAEHERSARRSLRRMSPTIDLDAIELHRLDKDTPNDEI